MGEKDKDKKKLADISNLFNIEILGLNLGKIIGEWVGDPEALQDPEQLEEVKRKIEERRRRFEMLREDLQSKTKGAVKIDYNVRIRTLDGSELRLGSRPLMYPKPETKAEEPREPIYDVLDKGDTLEVIMEVPGVREESLQVDVSENSLTLKTIEGSGRKYRLEIGLPVKVIKDEIKKTFNNGILIVTLRKQKAI